MTSKPPRVLSIRSIVLFGVFVVLVAAGSAIALLWAFGGGSPQDAAKLDAIRTTASIVLGTGGAAALALAARRQRSTELDLVQREHDATERRDTELYSKAAEQLGSDQAPVRLAGLYALERLGQSSPSHRQTVVDLICAYLRMPYSREGTETKRDPKEELHVRVAAQKILGRHLKRFDPLAGEENYWPWMAVDLSGAVLIDLDFRGTGLTEATFTGATFGGFTSFRGAQISGGADFERATFEDDVTFAKAKFSGRAMFGFATFRGGLSSFTGVIFRASADFEPATFEGAASFREASFHGQFRANYAKSPGAMDVGDAVFNPEFEPPPGWEFGARNAEGLCPLVRSTGEAATP